MVVVDCDLFPLIRTILYNFLNASTSERLIPSLVRPHASLISSGVHGCMIKRQQFLISSALSVIWILSLSRFNSSQNKLWGHLKFVQYKSKLNVVHISQSSPYIGGAIHDQMIRNKKRQKMIAIIRAIKFKILIGSAIWSEGINSFSAEETYFSIKDI